MTYYTISIGDHAPTEIDSIQRSREMIDVSGPVSKPDERWVFTDAFGHVHRWGKVDEEWTLPSLVWTMVPCDGACHDPEHEVREYHCAYCDIEVEPQWKQGYEYRQLPGPTEITVKFSTNLALGYDRIENVVVYQDGRPYLTGHGYVIDAVSHCRPGEKPVTDVEMSLMVREQAPIG